MSETTLKLKADFTPARRRPLNNLRAPVERFQFKLCTKHQAIELAAVVSMIELPCVSKTSARFSSVTKASSPFPFAEDVKTLVAHYR